jgi:hypothetical protein
MSAFALVAAAAAGRNDFPNSVTTALAPMASVFKHGDLQV